MKKIDVHVHTSMWDNAIINSGAILATPEEIREIYKKLGIEKGILQTLVSPEFRVSVQTNEESEYLANKYPDLFYWFCNVDPRMDNNHPDADLSIILNMYKKRGAIGVGEITAGLTFDDPLMDNLFYHCAKCDMPILIHISHSDYDSYGIRDDLNLPGLERTLKKHPTLKVIGHSQCFWSEISSDVTEDTRYGCPKGKVTPGRVVELMRNYDNMYADISAGSGYNAISRDPEFGYWFLEEFQDKILFGTDICTNAFAIPLSQYLDEAVKNGKISEEAYRKISRENAIKLFNLK